MLGKFPAVVGAAPACFGAILHATDAVAVVGALFANLSACHTYGPINWRADKEDVSASTTHLCTGHNEAIVLGFYMLATQFETVMHRSAEANLIAAKTRLYTMPRIAFDCLHRRPPSGPLGLMTTLQLSQFAQSLGFDLDQASRTLAQCL